MRDFMLQLHCKWDRRSSGMFCTVGSWIPTLRDNLLVPKCFRHFSLIAWALKMGPIGCAETFVPTNLHRVTSHYSGDVSALHVIVISVGYFQFVGPWAVILCSIILNISVSVLDNTCKCRGEKRVTECSASDDG